MAARSRPTSEEKVLKVLCNESSNEKIAVVASTYQEFVDKCTKKLRLTDDSDFKVYTEDTTLLDEEYFRFIANESVVRLTPEKHLALPPIVVRVTEKGNVYQFGEKNILVHINVTDKFVDFLGDVIDDIHDDEEILTLKWSKEDEDANRRFILGLKTQVTLKTMEVTRDAEKMILKFLGGDHSRVFRSITEKFFIRYNAMLTSLSTGCLRLWFSFISENERRTMKQDLPSVEKMLKSMVLPPNLRKNPEMGFAILRQETQEFTLPRSEYRHENDQHSYKRGDDTFAQILKSLDSRILRENSLECIYQTCRSFSDNLAPVIDREDILYTVLCLDRSKSLRKETFNDVRSFAIQYFKELDKSTKDPTRLDECVAILSFGDSLTNVTDFSFEIQSQISLIEHMEQASGTSGPAHVFEAVVAADLLLKKYGKTRKFKEVNGEEYLRPRVVLITGSGAGEIIDDNALQLMQWLENMDACYPVYCYNVQQSQNQRLLSFLTSQSNGKLIPDGRSALLGKFHKLKMNKIVKAKSQNAQDIEDIDFLFG